MNSENENNSKKGTKPGVIQVLAAKVIAKIGIAIIVVVGLIYLIILGLETANQSLKNIAEGFNSGKVVSEFHDFITRIEGNNRLVVATLKSVDTFSRQDSKSMLWGLIDLPDVEIEIQAPIEYTYYLELKDPWKFKWKEGDLGILVTAPKIQCGTPAVNVSNMKIIERKGSILRDVDEIKEKLVSEVTEKLMVAASVKIPLIRETARSEVRQFVYNWFLNFYFKDNEVKPKYVYVYFADEKIPIKESTPLRLETKE